jgi:rare lipoprotein A (peptidoglycan hydrolase)
MEAAEGSRHYGNYRYKRKKTMNNKYIFLIIGMFFWILSNAGLNAQTYTRTFRQRGPATYTISSEALEGSHSNLSIGTKVLVTNLQNNQQVTITITGRIVASGWRIIDLSDAAARVLEIEEQFPVSVFIEVVRREKSEYGVQQNNTGKARLERWPL